MKLSRKFFAAALAMCIAMGAAPVFPQLTAAASATTIDATLAKPVIKTCSNTATGVMLKWTAVSGANSYTVFRKKAGGDYKAVKTVSSTSWRDTTAENGKAYKYKIAAVSDAGRGPCSKDTTIVFLEGTYIKSLKSEVAGRMYVDCKGVSNVDGYQIQYSLNSDMSEADDCKTNGAANDNRTIVNLKDGRTYYFRVRTYKTYSGTKYKSTWSAIKAKMVKVKEKTAYIGDSDYRYHKSANCSKLKDCDDIDKTTDVKAEAKGYVKCSKCW